MNRPRLALCAVLASLAAGAAAGIMALAADEPRAPSADEPKAPPAAGVVTIGKGAFDGRPQLGRALVQIAGDEYVLMCSAAGQAGLRTTLDGGAHWSEMTPLGPGDTVNAAFDGRSSLYVVYWRGFTGSYVKANREQLHVRFRKLMRTGPGQWQPDEERAVPGSHHAGSVAVEPSGRVWVTYCRINDRGYEAQHAGGNIKAVSTIDAGRTWSPVSFPHLTGSGDSSVKHALMEWQGRPTIVWSFWDAGGMSWGYWDGSMWTRLRDVSPLLSPDLTYAACEDGQGRLHVVFNHYGLHLYHMVYDGRAWSRAARIYEGEMGGCPALGCDGASVWCVWALKDRLLAKRFADGRWDAEPRVVAPNRQTPRLGTPVLAGGDFERPCLPARIAPGTRRVPLVWRRGDELACIRFEFK